MLEKTVEFSGLKAYKQNFLLLSPTFIVFNLDQWRIQDFPEEGAPTLQGGANIRFCQIFPKTA